MFNSTRFEFIKQARLSKSQSVNNGVGWLLSSTGKAKDVPKKTFEIFPPKKPKITQKERQEYNEKWILLTDLVKRPGRDTYTFVKKNVFWHF